MQPGTPQDVSSLVRAWSRGDPGALERLVPLVEAELRRIARRRLDRMRPEPGLQTTSLIQETYLRLTGVKTGAVQNRAHFFALCAHIIRGILVDHARRRGAVKRGGGRPAAPLEHTALALREQGPDLLAVDEALKTLERMDARRGRVVELRFFGGLTVEETAASLGVSPETVKRDWRVAKLWLMKELGWQSQPRPG